MRTREQIEKDCDTVSYPSGSVPSVESITRITAALILEVLLDIREQGEQSMALNLEARKYVQERDAKGDIERAQFIKDQQGGAV